MSIEDVQHKLIELKRVTQAIEQVIDDYRAWKQDGHGRWSQESDFDHSIESLERYKGVRIEEVRVALPNLL